MRQRPQCGLFPGLTAKPWHDAKDYPWAKKLSESHMAIRGELHRVMRMSQELRKGNAVEDGTWNSFNLFVMGQATSHGLQNCPKTMELISHLPSAGELGLIYFSGLSPGSRIKPHFDMSNALLRLHLGLVVPEGCSITVDGQTRTWQEGECLIFDGSFEHEVWHRGNESRWVLILDFWHPELTSAERKAMVMLSHLRSRERRVRQRLIQQKDVAYV